MRHVVHLTTVHPRTDTRILHREAASLAAQPDWQVTLMVADGLGDSQELIDGHSVEIKDIGALKPGRMRRALGGMVRSCAAVARMRPNIVHFHDPELIPAGFFIKLLGIRVIYDVHEDVPNAVLNKFWLPAPLRRVVGSGVTLIEWLAGKLFDGLVCATPTIANRFPQHKTANIQNFPVVKELHSSEAKPFAERPGAVAYVGAISETRGAKEMLEALELVNARRKVSLELAGSTRPASLQRELEAMPGWAHVRFHGWSSRKQVAQLLSRVSCGLVTLHPTPSYVDAYPVKMFEYMAAGLPVIASDFPLWRTIVDQAGCGLLVDPNSPSDIADAVQRLLDDPAQAQAMGERGKRAVMDVYNWSVEERKLLGIYGRIFGTAA